MNTDHNATERLAELDALDGRKQDTEEALQNIYRERRRIIHDLFYLDGVGAQEIADRLLISPQMVRRLAAHHMRHARAVRRAGQKQPTH